MKIKKTYLNLAEVAAAIGNCTELDVLHLGSIGKLPIYSIPDRWIAHFYGVESLENTDPAGITTSIETETIRKSREPVVLTDPVQLFQSTLQRLETVPSVNEHRFVAPTPEQVDEFIRCEFRIQTQSALSKGVEVSRTALIVFDTDLQDFLAIEGVDMDKPLGTRERNTLLLIIAALAKGNGIDLTKSSAAAVPIQSLVEQLGETIGLTTIEGHIKRIPVDLLEQTKPKP